MSPFAWLVRREVWETRAVWIAPAICAAILIVFGLFGSTQLGGVQLDARSAASLSERLTEWGPDGVARRAGLLMLVAAFPFYVTMLFTQLFYSMDALYGDRRDRSVLFWKSLPISDADTVLSKLVVASLVIPLFALLGAFVGQLATYAIATWKLGAALPLPVSLWSPAVWLPALGATAYGAFAIMLWTLPLVGWLFFVSAVVPRSPFMWATLVPLAIGFAERLAFGTTRFFELLGERVWGVFGAAFGGISQDGVVVRIGEPDGPPTVVGSLVQPAEFLAEPGLWIGLAVGAAFVAGAVWARRYRDEST